MHLEKNGDGHKEQISKLYVGCKRVVRQLLSK